LLYSSNQLRVALDFFDVELKHAPKSKAEIKQVYQLISNQVKADNGEEFDLDLKNSVFTPTKSHLLRLFRELYSYSLSGISTKPELTKACLMMPLMMSFGFD
jgi:hypothetical protein